VTLKKKAFFALSHASRCGFIKVVLAHHWTVSRGKFFFESFLFFLFYSSLAFFLVLLFFSSFFLLFFLFFSFSFYFYISSSLRFFFLLTLFLLFIIFFSSSFPLPSFCTFSFCSRSFFPFLTIKINYTPNTGGITSLNAIIISIHVQIYKITSQVIHLLVNPSSSKHLYSSLRI
jgi:hypothetical protein